MTPEPSLKKILSGIQFREEKNNSVLYGNEKGIHSILGKDEMVDVLKK